MPRTAGEDVGTAAGQANMEHKVMASWKSVHQADRCMLHAIHVGLVIYSNAAIRSTLALRASDCCLVTVVLL